MARTLTVGVAARLSRYLQVLTQARKMGKDRISSQEISDYTNINATQIRRDLSAFGKFGKRGVGYNIEALLGEIRKILRTQGQHNIALVGAGRLGQAIASSPIFAEHGINIAAVFDIDPDKVGRTVGGVAIDRYGDLKETVREKNIIVGVLAVPPRSAQQAADDLVDAGVKILFNYSEALLDVPAGRRGAHLEPRRRPAVRAVLPPDLGLVRRDVRTQRRPRSGPGRSSRTRRLRGARDQHPVLEPGQPNACTTGGRFLVLGRPAVGEASPRPAGMPDVTTSRGAR